MNDGGATHVIQLDGVDDVDGTVSLAVGSNVITIVVTAEDGETTKTYTVTVDRAAPTAPGPAVTIGLSPSGPVAEGTEITVTMSFGGLEQDSDRTTKDYIFRADVKNSENGDADNCEDRKGGYGLGVDRYMSQVDEDPEVRTGTISASCAPGDYTVEVSISSPDNVELALATADFTVAAPAQQPDPLSTDATLSDLALSGVAFGTFDPATTGYTASVANDVERATVTATTNDDGATYVVQLDGVDDADGTVELAVGENTVSVVVTAEDGTTTKTYTVTVTRAAPPLSTDAGLSGLALSGVTLEPAFATDTTEYTAEVGNDVTETTVTTTTNDSGATYVVQLDGVDDADGAIPLSVGQNVITIQVTAEDEKTVKTYTVTVTRAAPPLSADATLSGLALSGIDIGAFDPNTGTYDVSVAHDVEQTTVTATPNHDGATYVVQLDGTPDSDGTVSLAVGENPIGIIVTAEDGETTKTYTVTVTRAAPPASDDATLSRLELSGISLEFDPATTGYAAEVANDVSETTVRATTNHDGATYVVQLDGAEDADGTVDLAVGENAVSVVVTAEDGETTKTYTVTITRAAAEPTPDNPPEAPDAPTGKVTGFGQVQLDWNDVAEAAYYQVRFFYASYEWVELPAHEIEIAIDGSGAAVSNLPDYGFYYFSVRAGNGAGVSEWSDYLTLQNPR